MALDRREELTESMVAFKTDPREALKVPLEAAVEDALAKHLALLPGVVVVGEGVRVI